MSLPAPPSIFGDNDPMAAPQTPADRDAVLAAWMSDMLIISQKQLELSMLIQRLVPEHPDKKVYRSASSRPDAAFRSLSAEDDAEVMPQSVDAIMQREADARRITELNAELAALFLRVNALKLRWVAL